MLKFMLPRLCYREGKYVYVVGNLKSLHSRRHLNITAIRPIKNHDEVLHHYLEVISAFLYNTRGAVAPNNNAQAGGQEDVVAGQTRS